MITEILEALGSWDITLDQATPRSVVDQLGYFGHLVVVDGPVDVDATGEALLDVARYVGVLRERDADARKFAGSGLVYWLGDEDDKGDLIEAELTLTSKTLAECVAAVLPAAAPAGTIYAQPVPAQRYTGSHRYQTRRKALSIICDAFGVEFRVNNDGTVDVGTRAQLYQGVPRTDGRPTPVIARQAGADIDLVALEGKLSAKGAVYDYSTRVVLLGQTTDAGQFATGSRDAASVPYVDLHGNAVKSTRLISESTETVGSVDARSQLQLNRFNRETRTLQLQVDDYVTEGTARVGDDCYVYDPDTGIFNTATQVAFRGDTIFPDVIRISGVTWPVTQGMTVAFRTGAGVWLDLTPFVTWETGGGQVTIGDLPSSLSRPGDDPISLRVDAARSTSTVQPNPPTGLTLTSYTVADPRTGLSTGRITIDFTAPTANVDSSVPPNVAYYVVQWKWTSRSQWESTYTAGTVDVAAVLDLDYDVRVAAVSASGVMSTWLTGSVHVTRDTIGPPAPADPTVDGDAWAGQLRVSYSGFTAAAARMPADTNRVDVHVGTTAGFVHSPDTLHSSLTPFGSGIDLVETAPGTTRYVKLVAVDNAGNESTPSATVAGTARAVRDGDVLSMSVSKLLAGTIGADVVMAGRITTALTGARREINSVGFQGWDASNNLTISLDGVNNLLTGIFQTALAGRRIIMGAAGAVGEIDFIAPDGTKTFMRAWTEVGGVEAIQFGVAGAGGDVTSPSSLWNRINYNNDSGGYANYRANKHEFLFGDADGVLNDGDGGFFHVFQVPTTAGTGGAERFLLSPTNNAMVHRSAAAGTPQLLSSSDSGFTVWGTPGTNQPSLSLAASDGYLLHGTNVANAYHEFKANGDVTFAMGTDNGSLTFYKSGFGGDISPLMQLATANGQSLAWRTLFDGTNAWLEAVVWTQSSYAGVRGASFTSVSDATTKTDITPTAVDALAEVRATAVVDFRRKPSARMRRTTKKVDGRDVDVEEVDDSWTPPQQPIELGLTAQGAPASIVRPLANGLFGIDNSAFDALNMRAIQQLADRVDDVLDRVNALDRKGGRAK